MNLLEAFAQLDTINESASTDAYQQTLASISALEQEIQSLRTEKDSSWSADYKKRLASEEVAIKKLRDELQAIRQSYKELDPEASEIERTEDRIYYYNVYKDNPEKKAAVAEQEAALLAQLKELEAKYEELYLSIKAQHEADFAGHTQAIADKKAQLDAKKKDKETTLADINKEELPELQRLYNKLHKYLKGRVLPPEKVSVWNNALVATFKILYEYEPDSDDFDWFDEDDVRFNSSAAESYASDKFVEEDFFDIAVNCLDIDEASFDRWQSSNDKEPIKIPDSNWMLAKDFDIEVGDVDMSIGGWSGDGWNEPREFDFDYGNAMATVQFYLIKNL